MMIVLKRPVITCLIFYAVFIIVLEYLGFFTAQKQSFLIHNSHRKNIQITGKVTDEPVIKNSYQQFIFEVLQADGISIKEKTLASVSKNYNIKYGDILCLSGRIIEVEEPVFPYIFNYKTYLQRQNIYTKFYASEYEFIESDPSYIKYYSFKIRNDINNRIDTFFRMPYSAIIKSMLTGDKTFLDNEIKNNFINSGVIHILVISGLHIGFWVIIFVCLFRIFQLPLKYAMFLTIPALFFYSVITGANPPAIRATVMASCIILCFILNREPLVYNAISLSALIILLYSPQSLFTASFQLSFIATLGIIYLYPKIKYVFGSHKNFLMKRIIDVFCVTLCVQIALIPVLMFYFGKISMSSFIANILILPVVFFIVCLSFAFYIFSFISPFCAMLSADVLSLILKIILYIINCCANVKFAVLYCGVPDYIDIILYYAAVILMTKYKYNIKYISVISCIILSMYVLPLKKSESVQIFENNKSITYHIKNGDENIIAFRQKGKDKFFINNLNQYLLMSATLNIAGLYCDTDTETIKTKFKNIKINSVLPLDKFKTDTGFEI